MQQFAVQDKNGKERFRVGGRVRGLTSVEFALNNFAVDDTPIRVRIRSSSMSRKIVASDALILAGDRKFDIETIDDSDARLRIIIANQKTKR